MEKTEESKQVRVGFIYLKDDDPKKSTMKKLERFGLANITRPGSARGMVLLTPYAKKMLLPSDSGLIKDRGICIIEGSWKKHERFDSITGPYARFLPKLLAVNPVNYGKIGLLSSVEALASALYITGFRDQAGYVLSKFNWGMNFIQVNLEPLTLYSTASTEDEMKTMEAEFF